MVAIAAGCDPLLPDALAYPEILPAGLHPPHLYRDLPDLVERTSPVLVFTADSLVAILPVAAPPAPGRHEGGGGMMKRTSPLLFTVLATTAMLALAVGETQAAWKTVTVDLETPDGIPAVVRGSGIAYGWYVRHFTPKGVKDRLQTDKKTFLFQDHGYPMRDLVSVEFEYEVERTTGIRTPSKVHLSYIRPGAEELLTVDRPVSGLQGFGGPKPIVLVVTTADGTTQIDLTPPLDQEARKRYRPVLRILFE